MKAEKVSPKGAIRHRGYQPKASSLPSSPPSPPNKGSAVYRPQNSSGGKVQTADRVVKQRQENHWTCSRLRRRAISFKFAEPMVVMDATIDSLSGIGNLGSAKGSLITGMWKYYKVRTMLKSRHVQVSTDMFDAVFGFGACVPEDDIQAYAWISLASAQGVENAKKAKELLTGEMTRAEIAEAQKLSREYREAFGPNLYTQLVSSGSPRRNQCVADRQRRPEGLRIAAAAVNHCINQVDGLGFLPRIPFTHKF